MTLTAFNQPTWWQDRILIPAVFVLLGAIVGLAGTQVTNWLDRRRAKRAFLQAIKLELDGLREQLHAASDEVSGSKERLQKNAAALPQLAFAPRTTVFTSQLGRISDLSDPVIVDVIKLYSDISILPQIIETLNHLSSELSLDDAGAQHAQNIDRVLSALTALGLQVNGFIMRVRNLAAKL